MGGEDCFFVDGPGRNFNKAYRSAVKEATSQQIATEAVAGLRAFLREGHGPVTLVNLALNAGVLCPEGTLPLFTLGSRKYVDEVLRCHRLPGGPVAGIEADVVERACMAVRLGLPTSFSLVDLHREYCLRTMETLCFGRLEAIMDLPTAERVDRMDACRQAAADQIRGDTCDIVQSLLRDATGYRVARRARVPKSSTADLIGEIVPLS